MLGYLLGAGAVASLFFVGLAVRELARWSWRVIRGRRGHGGPAGARTGAAR